MIELERCTISTASKIMRLMHLWNAHVLVEYETLSDLYNIRISDEVPVLGRFWNDTQTFDLSLGKESVTLSTKDVKVVIQ